MYCVEKGNSLLRTPKKGKLSRSQVVVKSESKFHAKSEMFGLPCAAARCSTDVHCTLSLSWKAGWGRSWIEKDDHRLITSSSPDQVAIRVEHRQIRPPILHFSVGFSFLLIKIVSPSRSILLLLRNQYCTTAEQAKQIKCSSFSIAIACLPAYSNSCHYFPILHFTIAKKRENDDSESATNRQTDRQTDRQRTTTTAFILKEAFKVVR